MNSSSPSNINDELVTRDTGDIDSQKLFDIAYRIGKYLVVVQVNQNREFMGISEIRVDEDFLSPMQRASQGGYHDVHRFYFEE